MAGGLIQLMSYGYADKPLIFDPEITFFKVIYYKHSLFSIQEQLLSSENDINFGSSTNYKIRHNGDLFFRPMLEINLPSVTVEYEKTLDDYISKYNSITKINNLDINFIVSNLNTILYNYAPYKFQIYITDNLIVNSYYDYINSATIKTDFIKLYDDEYYLIIDNLSTDATIYQQYINTVTLNANSTLENSRIFLYSSLNINYLTIFLNKTYSNTDFIIVDKDYYQLFNNNLFNYITSNNNELSFLYSVINNKNIINNNFSTNNTKITITNLINFKLQYYFKNMNILYIYENILDSVSNSTSKQLKSIAINIKSIFTNNSYTNNIIPFENLYDNFDSDILNDKIFHIASGYDLNKKFNITKIDTINLSNNNNSYDISFNTDEVNLNSNIIYFIFPDKTPSEQDISANNISSSNYEDYYDLYYNQFTLYDQNIYNTSNLLLPICVLKYNDETELFDKITLSSLINDTDYVFIYNDVFIFNTTTQKNEFILINDYMYTIPDISSTTSYQYSNSIYLSPNPNIIKDNTINFNDELGNNVMYYLNSTNTSLNFIDKNNLENYKTFNFISPYQILYNIDNTNFYNNRLKQINYKNDININLDIYNNLIYNQNKLQSINTVNKNTYILNNLKLTIPENITYITNILNNFLNDFCFFKEWNSFTYDTTNPKSKIKLLISPTFGTSYYSNIFTTNNINGQNYFYNHFQDLIVNNINTFIDNFELYYTEVIRYISNLTNSNTLINTLLNITNLTSYITINTISDPKYYEFNELKKSAIYFKIDLSFNSSFINILQNFGCSVNLINGYYCIKDIIFNNSINYPIYLLPNNFTCNKQLYLLMFLLNYPKNGNKSIITEFYLTPNNYNIPNPIPDTYKIILNTLNINNNIVYLFDSIDSDITILNKDHYLLNKSVDNISKIVDINNILYDYSYKLYIKIKEIITSDFIVNNQFAIYIDFMTFNNLWHLKQNISKKSINGNNSGIINLYASTTDLKYYLDCNINFSSFVDHIIINNSITSLINDYLTINIIPDINNFINNIKTDEIIQYINIINSNNFNELNINQSISNLTPIKLIYIYLNILYSIKLDIDSINYDLKFEYLLDDFNNIYTFFDLSSNILTDTDTGTDYNGSIFNELNTTDYELIVKINNNINDVINFIIKLLQSQQIIMDDNSINEYTVDPINTSNNNIILKTLNLNELLYNLPLYFCNNFYKNYEYLTILNFFNNIKLNYIETYNSLLLDINNSGQYSYNYYSNLQQYLNFSINDYEKNMDFYRKNPKYNENTDIILILNNSTTSTTTKRETFYTYSIINNTDTSLSYINTHYDIEKTNYDNTYDLFINNINILNINQINIDTIISNFNTFFGFNNSFYSDNRICSAIYFYLYNSYTVNNSFNLYFNNSDNTSNLNYMDTDISNYYSFVGFIDPSNNIEYVLKNNKLITNDINNSFIDYEYIYDSTNSVYKLYKWEGTLIIKGSDIYDLSGVKLYNINNNNIYEYKEKNLIDFDYIFDFNNNISNTGTATTTSNGTINNISFGEWSFGKNWFQQSSSPPLQTANNGPSQILLSTNGKFQLSFRKDKVWISINNGYTIDNIIQTPSASYTFNNVCMTSTGNIIYLFRTLRYTNKGVFVILIELVKLTDFGRTFVANIDITSYAANTNASACSANGQIILAACDNNIAFSKNGGNTWSNYPSTTTQFFTNCCISADGQKMYAFQNSYNTQKLYISTDAGTNWTIKDVSSQLIRPSLGNNGMCCSADGKYIYFTNNYLLFTLNELTSGKIKITSSNSFYSITGGGEVTTLESYSRPFLSATISNNVIDLIFTLYDSKNNKYYGIWISGGGTVNIIGDTYKENVAKCTSGDNFSININTNGNVSIYKNNTLIGSRQLFSLTEKLIAKFGCYQSNNTFSNIIFYDNNNTTPYYSSDFGITFNHIQNLPAYLNWAMCGCDSTGQNVTFGVSYDNSNGSIYCSTNYGNTFIKVQNPQLSNNIRIICGAVSGNSNTQVICYYNFNVDNLIYLWNSCKDISDNITDNFITNNNFNSIKLDGINQYITIPGLQFSDTGFSISFWAQFNVPSGNSKDIMTFFDNNNQKVLQFYLQNGYNLFLTIYINGVSKSVALNTEQNGDNTWRFYTYTISYSNSSTGTGTMKAYVNGILKWTQNNTFYFNTTSPLNLYIATTSQYYNMSLSQLCIKNDVLSQDNITKMYNDIFIKPDGNTLLSITQTVINDISIGYIDTNTNKYIIDTEEYIYNALTKIIYKTYVEVEPISKTYDTRYNNFYLFFFINGTLYKAINNIFYNTTRKKLQYILYLPDSNLDPMNNFKLLDISNNISYDIIPNSIKKEISIIDTDIDFDLSDVFNNTFSIDNVQKTINYLNIDIKQNIIDDTEQINNKLYYILLKNILSNSIMSNQYNNQDIYICSSFNNYIHNKNYTSSDINNFNDIINWLQNYNNTNINNIKVFNETDQIIYTISEFIDANLDNKYFNFVPEFNHYFPINNLGQIVKPKDIIEDINYSNMSHFEYMLKQNTTLKDISSSVDISSVDINNLQIINNISKLIKKFIITQVYTDISNNINIIDKTNSYFIIDTSNNNIAISSNYNDISINSYFIINSNVVSFIERESIFNLSYDNYIVNYKNQKLYLSDTSNNIDYLITTNLENINIYEWDETNNNTYYKFDNSLNTVLINIKNHNLFSKTLFIYDGYLNRINRTSFGFNIDSSLNLVYDFKYDFSYYILSRIISNFNAEINEQNISTNNLVNDLSCNIFKNPSDNTVTIDFANNIDILLNKEYIILKDILNSSIYHIKNVNNNNNIYYYTLEPIDISSTINISNNRTCMLSYGIMDFINLLGFDYFDYFDNNTIFYYWETFYSSLNNIIILLNTLKDDDLKNKKFTLNGYIDIICNQIIEMSKDNTLENNLFEIPSIIFKKKILLSQNVFDSQNTIKSNLDNLTKIYKSYKQSTSDLYNQLIRPDVPKCSWIPFIGHFLVNKIDFKIDNNIIEEIDDQIIHNFNFFNSTVSKDIGLNQMIGNTPDLTMKQEIIPKKTLYVPLPLFFADKEKALPIISMLNSQLSINLKVKNINKLLKIPSGTKIKQLSKLKIKLCGSYVYLDTDERYKFAQMRHEYLIKTKKNIKYFINQKIGSLKLELNLPSTEMFWFYLDQSIKANNDYWNYTGIKYKEYYWNNVLMNDFDNNDDVNDYINMLTKNQVNIINKYTNNLISQDLNNNLSLLKASELHSLACYLYGRTRNSNPFISSQLVYNGHKRFNVDGIMSSLVTPLTYYRDTFPSGLNVYTFCRNPKSIKHSGSLNFKYATNINFDYSLEFKDNHRVNGEINIIICELNVLRIASGIGCVAW